MFVFMGDEHGALIAPDHAFKIGDLVTLAVAALRSDGESLRRLSRRARRDAGGDLAGDRAGTLSLAFMDRRRPRRRGAAGGRRRSILSACAIDELLQPFAHGGVRIGQRRDDGEVVRAFDFFVARFDAVLAPGGDDGRALAQEFAAFVAADDGVEGLAFGRGPEEGAQRFGFGVVELSFSLRLVGMSGASSNRPEMA